MPEVTAVSILASSPAEFGAIASVFVLAACFAITTIVLVHALRRARGTTLAVPIVWSSTSLAMLCIAPVAMCRLPWTIPSDGLFLLAATSTLCPMIALLGAKRPQNRAWQFIVISFWFMAAWPVIQRLLFPDRPIDVPAFWRWFYGAVILIEVVNYWPTFFCTAALLAAG